MNNGNSVFAASEATFDREVLERSHDTLVVVDFWAPWCGPCRMLGPILERLAREEGSNFLLGKLNVDDNPSLARYYGVQGIPAVKAFRDGQVVDEFVGAQPEGLVRAFLQRLLPSEGDAERRRAETLSEQHRWAEAETIYRSLLEDESSAENTESTLGLLRALLGQGKGCEGQEVLEQLPDPAAVPESEWLAPLATYLCTAEGADLAAADLSDLEASYLHAAKLIRRGDFAAALEQLLDVLQYDKDYAGGQARSAVLGLFALLGDDSELTRTYRPALATILF